jgi:thiol-disulfide isomerase/thioredoxin
MPEDVMRDPAAREPAERVAPSPGLVVRLGMVISDPRWTLAAAGDRRHAGRSGSDLLAAIAVVLVATQLRAVASAVWLAVEVAPGFGVRAALRALTDALTLPLVLLVVGGLAVFALAGSRRSLGRAFDLACVAVLPLLVVKLVATAVVQLVGVPGPVSWLIPVASYSWMGALIAIAIQPARSAPVRVSAPPGGVVTRARRLGWTLAAVAAIGVATQTAWIARNLELVRPMTSGGQAPDFALPEIGPSGELGDRVTLAATRGKVTVLDFWATWCQPCLAAMPRLDKLARSHPDVAVLAINLDDAAHARALFTERGYTMKLLADDGDASQRYGVSSIPHTVVIDRSGVVRDVIRGTGTDIASVVESLAGK